MTPHTSRENLYHVRELRLGRVEGRRRTVGSGFTVRGVRTSLGTRTTGRWYTAETDTQNPMSTRRVWNVQTGSNLVGVTSRHCEATYVTVSVQVFLFRSSVRLSRGSPS